MNCVYEISNESLASQRQYKLLQVSLTTIHKIMLSHNPNLNIFKSYLK